MQRFRQIEFEQNKDNRYTVTVTIRTENNQEMIEVPGEKISQIISRIELNPEDIIIIQKFVNMCIDELLNL
jgi:hypothetical protein